MKAATLKQLKTELQMLPNDRLVELCLRLIKYKKENKELLTYLIFESGDENAYIRDVKLQMVEDFSTLNASSLFLAKKTIRKVLRIANKYIKYSGKKQTEVEVLIFFCKLIRGSGISLSSSKAIHNLYHRQLDRIHKAVSSLHEDLQFDYSAEIDEL